MQKYLFGVGLLVVLGFLNFSGTNLLDDKVQQIISKTNLFNLRFPQERVYLHLDRPSYWAGDDFWFKAYVKDSPVNESNLYIEIINASGDVVNKNIAWVQNGLAYGDFHLADTLSSGVYQIRAYTNWMRNFDEVWFFHKDLVIWNPRDKKIDAEPQKLRQRDIDLQFFPEGGTFVAGVKNRVAFKATDKQGKGIDFEGIITDDSGNKVADIKSIYKGIGSFVFQPESGKKYTAETVFTGNVEKKADLPKPQNEGVLLSVDALDAEKIRIQVVKKSSLNNSEEYTHFTQSGGNICHQSKITATGEISTIELNKAKLPGGILKFTLFSSNMVPVCERLVFNDYVDVVNLVIKPDKSEYKQREKVKIGVAAITNQRQPALANLSMSVYNLAAQLKDEEHANNIFTHFLLSSELKGTIENPAYYFKDDSLTTLQALDNLMLTHGYREFEWKEILEDKQPEITFQPENSIQVRGHVKNWFSGKPVGNCNVKMMFLKSQLAVHEQTSDKEGNFLFSNLYFYDTVYISIQGGNLKDKKRNWIEIDDRSSKSPNSLILPFNYKYYNDNQIETSYYLSEISSELLHKKWNLSDTILLGDINIIAKKRKKDDGHFRPYLDADYVFDAEKLSDGIGSIYDVIDGRIAGLRTEIMEEGRTVFFYRGFPASLFLDGIQVDYEFLTSFSSSSFDKVEFIKFLPFAGFNKSGSGIFFYTKRGIKFENAPKDEIGMKSARIIGYSVFRKFYTPVYDSPEQPEKKEDIRNTIFWNPLVMTDSSGVAIESFFQSDETGEMKIVVEGVTEDGRLCRGVARYNVK